MCFGNRYNPNGNGFGVNCSISCGHEYHSVKNSLDKLGLLKDGKLLNAAVILFGKKPQQFFPNAKLRCAAFATTTTSLIVDRQEFEGDLFYLINKAEEYILKNIHIGMRVEGMRMIDIPEIDKDAFREGIINAFCHRDYWKYDSVNIAVFKDRVEIRNPGLLYGNLTIEMIRKENVSERRNELIAEIFHNVHFVEKWGRGISLILSKEPDTEFKEVGTQFIVAFKRKELEKVGEKVGENELKVLSCWNRITKREKKGQVLRFISNIFASQKLGFGKVLLYQINLFLIKPFLKRFDVSILVLVDLSLRPQRLPLLYPFFSCLVAPFLHHLFTYIFYFTPYKYML